MAFIRIYRQQQPRTLPKRQLNLLTSEKSYSQLQVNQLQRHIV